ncbi:MAG: hypothetical protein AB7F91_17905 [Parvularculaceae bacterium]
MVRGRSTKSEHTELDSFALDPEELDRRVAASYPDFYLMIIGLIQGIATVFLVNSAINTPAFKALAEGVWPIEFSTAETMVFVRIILSLTLIVIVTYEYAYAIVMLRRYPRYADIYIPLFLGISEVLSIHFIYQTHLWWLMNGIASLAGIFAWWFTFRVSSLNFRPKTTARRRTWRQLILNVIITMTAVAICFNAFRLHWNGSLSMNFEVVHYIAYFLVGTILFMRGRRFLDALRKQLQIDANAD